MVSVSIDSLQSQPLLGKLAVVTGASRGIGLAAAKLLHRAGATVAMLARDLAALQRHATEIGSRAVAIQCDVSDSAAVAAARDQVNQHGQVDIVVNNAGSVVRGEALAMDDTQWRAMFATNVDGTFFVTRAFASDLIARHGRVINIASIAGRQGTPNLVAYCAAKHAVVGFTRALAAELHGKVSVNAICPGSVDTVMLQQGLPGAKPDMTPLDIANTILFLAASAPAALTGSCLDVFG